MDLIQIAVAVNWTEENQEEGEVGAWVLPFGARFLLFLCLCAYKCAVVFIVDEVVGCHFHIQFSSSLASSHTLSFALQPSIFN